MGRLLDRRAFTGAAAMLSASALGHGVARAQSGKAITLVVPFAAGGATDVVSRVVARRLAERLGQSIVVENVGGAGGVVGATRVSRAQPDGATLLMGTVATHAINPLMAKQSPYTPEKDFTPISLVATVPNILLVNDKLPARNVGEFVALLKASPGKYSYGSSGVGTPLHLSGELFKLMTGVQMDHVPYRGGAPAMNDLIGGQIPAMFDVLSGAASFVRSGSVRALAVTMKTRAASFPDVPTIAESGYPDYETYTWNAVFGPPDLPRDMVARLSSELRQTVAEPEIQERLKDLSAIPVGSTPEELGAQVTKELAKWGPVVAAAGLKQT